MNRQKPTTPTIDWATTPFPLEFENEEPESQVHLAISLLDTACSLLDRGVENGLSKELVNGVYDLVSITLRHLEPVRGFLSGLDYPELIDDFQRARREVILSRPTRGGA